MGTLTINNTSCGAPVIYPVEYGLLYNWYAAADERNISSSNEWRVPSIIDIETLLEYIDDYVPPSGESGDTWEYAGGMLKEEGIIHWENPNVVYGVIDYNFDFVGG